MEKVIIFSAPSGSGKTTLVQFVMSKFSQLAFSISCTTRPPRGNELHAKDYYFISPEEFKIKIQNKDFVEFEEVYTDQFYGTLKSEVQQKWQQQKVVIFDVDVKGGVALKNYFGDKALSIFIKPPSVAELEKRLKFRQTDHLDAISMRVAKAAEELTFENQFDVILINDDLETAKKEVVEIVRNFID